MLVVPRILSLAWTLLVHNACIVPGGIDDRTPPIHSLSPSRSRYRRSRNGLILGWGGSGVKRKVFGNSARDFPLRESWGTAQSERSTDGCKQKSVEDSLLVVTCLGIFWVGLAFEWSDVAWAWYTSNYGRGRNLLYICDGSWVAKFRNTSIKMRVNVLFIFEQKKPTTPFVKEYINVVVVALWIKHCDSPSENINVLRFRCGDLITHVIYIGVIAASINLLRFLKSWSIKLPHETQVVPRFHLSFAKASKGRSAYPIGRKQIKMHIPNHKHPLEETLVLHVLCYWKIGCGSAVFVEQGWSFSTRLEANAIEGFYPVFTFRALLSSSNWPRMTRQTRSRGTQISSSYGIRIFYRVLDLPTFSQ
jgi:hypothetical protein